MVAAWLDSDFEGGRHQGRLDKIAELEKTLYR
jgi:ribose 5-phosphate isomerase B